jgi:hypothetical protein
LMDAATAVMLGEAVADVMAPIVRELRDEIKALETRVVEAEARSMKFCGVWEEALSYGPGNAVTFDGGVWVCTRMTNERPGTGDGWQLAVKSLR